MLRPWVPLVALGLLWALGYSLGPGILDGAGAALLGLALASEALARLGPPVLRAWALWRGGRRADKARARAADLDWSVIDNSVSGRTRRDCERPETLGMCTGQDCLVYRSCDFAIKKPLPGRY